MGAFSDAMEDIRTRFYTAEEFPLISREIVPSSVLQKAMAFRLEQLRPHALRLNSAELDGLLMELTQCRDPELINRGIQVLCERCSPRILKLLSAVMQYYFESPAIDLLGKTITERCRALIMPESFLFKFAPNDNKPATLVETILEHKHDIHSVYKKYNIADQSPLAMQGSVLYFGSCDKNVYLRNYIELIGLIRSLSADAAFEIIQHYLDCLQIAEYIDLVNTAIAEKLGQPYISVDWKNYPIDLRDKFTQWSFLFRLKSHCKGMPQKFRVLVKYFKHIRNNYLFDGDETLIMDFGWLVLADPKNAIEAYLYKKDFFEQETAAWRIKGQPTTFMKKNSEIMTSREFMLSMSDSPCIKLIFEDVQYFFIEEVLDIKLEIEPDMRKS